MHSRGNGTQSKVLSISDRGAIGRISQLARQAEAGSSKRRMTDLLKEAWSDLTPDQLDCLLIGLSRYRDALLEPGLEQRRYDLLRSIGEQCQQQHLATGSIAHGIGLVVRELQSLASEVAAAQRLDISDICAELAVFTALEVGFCLQTYHEAQRQSQQVEMNRLRRRERVLDETQSLAALGSWELDIASNQLRCCPRTLDLLGLDADRMQGGDGQDLLLSHVLPSDRVVLQTLRNQALISGGDYEVRYSVSLDGLAARHLHERGRGLSNAEGIISQLLGVISDAETIGREDTGLHPSAMFDPLTGLSNRVHFHRNLQWEIEHGAGESQVFSLLVIDLNRFKQINDTRGHAVGDLVLVEVGQRMRRVLRAGEHVARLGDDEFAVIASSADPQAASLIAERMALALNRPHSIGAATLNLSASIGTSSFPFDGIDGDALLICAEAAMNEAKRNGLRFAAYQPEMSQRIHRRASIEARLERAIEQGLIEVYFQPQVALQGARLLGAEVLARWEDPDLGPIDPGEFVALAEECGLIHPLGKLIVERSFEQWRRWRELGGTADLRLAINMSSKQLEADDFVGFLGDTAARYALPPSDIDLELTESSVMRNPEQITAQLSLLREQGFGISIDDFGTGYSSLSHLRQLPITQIKLDRSFVSGLLESKRDLSVVSATLTIANDLEVSLIAEGVETEFQADKLRTIGYSCAQGYLFDRPLPASVFAAGWLSLAEPSSGSGSPP